ncbi:MAG: DUF3048 domain-containing protein [Actinobacteria bacterium]|nr:DUF3048 domain-containing protein [Actinomycetota bacterium]MCL5886835.1 DUF3048 domain-containing protein [Actinomycetota bacterium]
MVFSRFTRILLPFAALVMMALLAGCSAEQPAVTSPWPVATAERTIEKPPPPPIWPLTGMDAPDSATVVGRRIVSVKIDNAPVARPQSGLQAADIVYESITEGGITRFNCLFQSQVPEGVGPVRSARLSDIGLVPQYEALFVFSGASGRVNSAVRAARLQNLSQDAGVSYGYSRSRARSAPHNLYVDLNKIREEGTRRGHPAQQRVPRLAFAGSVPTTGTPTVSIEIPFSMANRVDWTYDPSRRVYLRQNNGSVHRDSLTGEQIYARNVVVMWAKTTPASAGTYDIQLVGSNRASVFRDGVRIDGTWQADKDSPPRFTSTDGSVIALAPGNTWMQVVAPQVNITVR